MAADGTGTDVSMPFWAKVTVALATLMAIVLVVLELECESWRHWWAERPIVAGLVSGGLLLGPLLLVFERLIEGNIAKREAQRLRAEQERWRDPALDALRTYRDEARRVLVTLDEQLRAEGQETGETVSNLDRAQLVELIAAQRPPGFAAVANAVRARATHSSSLAVSALYLLTLAPQLIEYREPVSSLQHAALDIADRCAAGADTGARGLADAAAAFEDEVNLLKEKLATVSAAPAPG
jgi:hypothetical protein